MWYIFGAIIIIAVIGISILAYYFVVGGVGGSSYTWVDTSSGECTATEGTYYGRSGTIYLKDDRINAFSAARFSFNQLSEGSVIFYFRYDSDVGGLLSMYFYSGTTIFSTLENMQDSVIANKWYKVELKFDCETDMGEVWIDDIFIVSGAFTIYEVDYCDGFAIRTDTSGMINGYIDMVSIS